MGEIIYSGFLSVDSYHAKTVPYIIITLRILLSRDLLFVLLYVDKTVHC